MNKLNKSNPILTGVSPERHWYDQGNWYIPWYDDVPRHSFLVFRGVDLVTSGQLDAHNHAYTNQEFSTENELPYTSIPLLLCQTDFVLRMPIHWSMLEK